jgi:hypothetical protein
VVRAGLAAWEGDDLLVDGYDVLGRGADPTDPTLCGRRPAGCRGGTSGEDAGRASGERPAEGRGEEGKGDVGRGNVPEASAAAGEALPSDDPTLRGPTPGSPTQIDPPPQTDREAQRPERAREPAEPDPGEEWMGTGVFRRQVQRRSR